MRRVMETKNFDMFAVFMLTAEEMTAIRGGDGKGGEDPVPVPPPPPIKI